MLFVVCFILAESIEIVARVYMPSYGQLGKSVTIVSLKISLENLIGDFSSVGNSVLFLLASWAKKDYIFSSFSFESLRCNLLSILLSHEVDPSS